MPGHLNFDSFKVIEPRYTTINQINLNDYINKYSLSSNKIFGDLREFSSRAVIESLDDNKNAYIIFFDKNNISSSFLTKQTDVLSIRYAPLGKTVLNGRTLEMLTKYEADPREEAKRFADIILDLSTKLPIDVVYIVGNRYSSISNFPQMVKACISQKAPHIPEIKDSIAENPHIIQAMKDLRFRYFLSKALPD